MWCRDEFIRYRIAVCDAKSKFCDAKLNVIRRKLRCEAILTAPKIMLFVCDFRAYMSACVSADLDPSRFWIPYDVTHCLGMRSSLKCRKVTYKMCVAHPRKWIRFLLAGTVLADLDGQKLRFCERRWNLRG